MLNGKALFNAFRECLFNPYTVIPANITYKERENGFQ